jgi:hypothetical protein
VVVARLGHPGIRGTLDLKTFCSLDQVALLPEMRRFANVEQDLAARGVQRKIVYSVPRMRPIPKIIAGTDLICTLPRLFAEETAPARDLVIRELPLAISDQTESQSAGNSAADQNTITTPMGETFARSRRAHAERTMDAQLPHS